MALEEPLLNAAANGIKTAYTHVGLLDALAELAGGSPAYARKTLAYGVTAAGDWTGTATFDVPAGSTVARVGFYTTLAGGVPVQIQPLLGDPEVYAGQGVFNLSVLGDVD